MLVGKSNLTTRLLTAAVVSPLLLVLLFLGPAWGWYLLLLGSTVVGGRELFAMTHPKDAMAQLVGVLSAAAVSLALYVFTYDAKVLLTVLFLVPLIGVLLPLWRLGDILTAGMRAMSGVAGPLYLGLLTALALVRRDLGADGPGYVLLALMFAWMADTGGYFAGRFLGKTPLYPAVSPKKTREGFFGAIAGAILGGALAHFWYLPSLPLLDALGLAIVCGALGQLGDLAESLLKRATAIKDSGSLIPGHGGMLDRIDALLLVSPAVFLYALWAGRTLSSLAPSGTHLH